LAFWEKSFVKWIFGLIEIVGSWLKILKKNKNSDRDSEDP
jgi:hypothetical protein